MKKYKCWVCGDIATETKARGYNSFEGVYRLPPSDSLRCYCQKCLKEVEETEKAEHKEYIRLKKKEMFRTAVELIEKQGINMNEHKEAIEAIEEHLLNNPDKYDSSYEIVAAIILIQNRIRINTQYKVGKYQVDFLLPDLMVVLEIDGERHQHKKSYDTERDAFIKKELGKDWEIIRIDTKYLDQNASRLVKAIKAVLDKR